MQRNKLLILMIFASAMFAGCSSTPVIQPAPVTTAGAASAPPVAPPSGAARTVAPAPVAIVSLAPHLDPGNPISTERSVYFDFEDFSVNGASLRVVELQGKYLASKPTLSVKIEGNTDERGGSEYNLALGQKRAEAVLKALKVYGVKDSQMEAISWGKERPKATGHDEAAWAKNRRADVVYPAQ